MRLVFSFLFVAFFLSASAQSQKQYRVQVVDSDKSFPLQNATIHDSSGVLLHQANAKGEFILNPNDGELLEIRVPGYYVFSFSVKWENINTLETRIIPMVKSGVILRETTVLDTKNRIVFDLHLRDFDFWADGLVMLEKGRFLITDLQLNLKYIVEHPVEFKKMERDARGNLFLFGKDSVYQIYVTQEQTYFYPPFSLESYERWIAPLELELDGKLIMRNTSPVEYSIPVSGTRAGHLRDVQVQHAVYHNKGVDYYCYEKGKPKRLVFSAVDTIAYRVAQQAFADYLGITIEIEQQFDLNGRYDVRKLFDRDVAKRTYNHLYAKWIPFPVFKKGDTICLFDHLASRVMLYDKDFNKEGAVKFNYPKKRRDPLVLQDLNNENLYAFEMKNGAVYLNGIAKNFSIKNSTFVDVFPVELKVHSNKAFYIGEENKIHIVGLKQ